MFVLKEGTENGKGTSEEMKKSILQWLENEGHVIRTKQEDKTFVDNKVQDEVDEIMSKRNSQLQLDIEELTGVKPEQNEKYYKYLKRAFSTKNASLEDKIKELEKDTGKNNDEEIQSLKEQIQELEGNLTEKTQEIEKVKTDYENKIKLENQQRNIDGIISDFKTKFKDLDEGVMSDAIENRKRKFSENYEITEKDGIQMIYSKKDNKPIRGNDGLPVKLEDHLKESFKDLFDESKTRSGGGTGQGGQGGDGASGEKPYSKILGEVQEKGGIKSQTQLYSYLRDEKKLDETGKEFNEAFKGVTEELKLPLT